jgi:MFS transporter, SHS family, lactate transporter
MLVLYIRTKVDESPAWLDHEHKGGQIFGTIAERWPLFIYMIVLMTAFNFFSHGTQDLYPTFLQLRRKFPQPTVAAIALIYNVGAIVGGLSFGITGNLKFRRTHVCGTTSRMPAKTFRPGISSARAFVSHPQLGGRPSTRVF